MKISYYPGCTLKTKAKNFEESTLCALKTLGHEVEEINRWNCCGTVFALTADDIIHHVAPIRNLIRTREARAEAVMTPCAMCYNTLKRANAKVRSDPETLKTLNAFIDAENISYAGDVKVLHLLEILRDEITFEKLAPKVVKPLTGLKVANYYGCLLVRPEEIGLDDVENPRVMENLCLALGAQPVDFPHRTECCGSYETVDHPEVVAGRAREILTSARERGAEVVAMSCPLCAFNLDDRQKQAAERFPDFKPIPVLYFSQLLAISLGCPEETLRLDLHFVDPKPVLEGKGYL
jgi:heterodisulfide reductase subunit B